MPELGSEYHVWMNMNVYDSMVGVLDIKLYADVPITAENFKCLCTGEKGMSTYMDRPLHYKMSKIHRIIPGFMIQTGDPLGTGLGDPGYQFEDELSSDKTFAEPYLVAMANSGPDTNGSQFFITVAPTPWLDNLHTIFGQVSDTSSRKVVDAIAAVPTGAQDKPQDDVIIKSIDIE